MNQSEPNQDMDGSCRECGDEIVVESGGKYDASDLEVCTDCWFDVLDGEERKELADRINKRLDHERN